MSRKQKGNKLVMWIILAIMVVAMAGFGLNSTISGSTSSTVLEVGESEITADEYYSALTSRMNDIARNQGQSLTMEEAKLLGIPAQVKTQLINQATMSEIARRNNLIASDEAIAEALLQITSFQDAQGRFSQNNFEIFLRNRGLTESEFLAGIRKDLERTMVIDVLDQQSIHLNAFTNSIAGLVGEKRSAQYIALKASDIENVEEPTDAAIRARFDSNPENYMAEPVQTIAIAYNVPDASIVTTEEAQEYYDANQAEFGTPAMVSYRLLSFPNEDDAKAFFENPDFSAEAQKRGLESADYLFEDQALSTLPDEIQQETTNKGAGLFEPVKGLLAWNVYEITKYSAAEIKPFSEVEDIAKTQIALNKTNDELAGEFDNIANLMAEGMGPEGIADTTTLEFVEWKSDDSAIVGVTDQEEFSNQVVSAPIGETSDLIKLSNGGVAVINRVSEAEALPLGFEDVQDQIKAELIEEATQIALDDQASRILEEAKSSNLTEVAAENGFEVETTELLNSESSYTAMPLPVAFDLFQKDDGEFWIGQDANARYIATVYEVESFDPNSEPGKEAQAAVDAQIQNAAKEGMIIDYLNAAATEFDAIEYPTLIEQVEAQIN